MPINKDTLREWIENISSEVARKGIDPPYLCNQADWARGFATCRDMLREWMEANACDHERARYESTYRDYERTGTAYARAFPYCPDCGKKMEK